MHRSRQLAAIMFTDIKGYTALMQQHEKKAIEIRNRHREVFNSITEKFGGRILQYYGDGTLSIFDSAIDAVECGIEMQLAWQKDPKVPVRVGIHTGDIIYNKEEIIGDSVNVASRVESLAVAGSVFISGKVYDEIKNQDNIQAKKIRSFQFKNVSTPIEVYAIANEGLVVPEADILEGKTAAPSTSATESILQSNSQAFLATKLFIPTPRDKVVERNRLIDQLQAGINRKLTLISASAGFGKTTLVTSWLEKVNIPVAWVSLDEGDSDSSRFLSYVVAALQKVKKQIGVGILQALQSPQVPPIETLLTALLNELAVLPDKMMLVLDDYHLIDSQEVDKILNFLVENLPPQLHLVIATREDPPLPLARMRVRRQVSELRVQDLRFQKDESLGFFQEVMGVELSQRDIQALDQRTEGWIAGLQMAALSLQGKTNVSKFIDAFTGSHHFIIDYLLEEVLNAQSEELRQFLLKTSILKKLNADLCKAVTENENSQQLLKNLDRDNLFIIPLDESRRWFRYHHLFGDVLQARAKELMPDVLPDLNQRAGHWFEEQGMAYDAIQHALAIQDAGRLADLIELYWTQLRMHHRESTFHYWMTFLDEDLIKTRPLLSFYYAFALLSTDLQAANQRLEYVEEWINGEREELQSLRGPSNEVEYQHLSSMLGVARAYYTAAIGDATSSLNYAKQVLETAPEGAHLWKGSAAALQGFYYWWIGDLQSAQDAIWESRLEMQKAGEYSAIIMSYYIIADLRFEQGRLKAAWDINQRALQLAADHPDLILQGMLMIYVGMADLQMAWGDLIQAEALLKKGKSLGTMAVLKEMDHRWPLSMAQLKFLQSDLQSAHTLINEAEQVYSPSPSPNLKPVDAVRTRIWIKEGRLRDAQEWVKSKGLSVENEVTYLEEYTYLTYAHLLLAQYEANELTVDIQDLARFLDRLSQGAKAGGRNYHLIECLILECRLKEALGKQEEALRKLKVAIQLAAPEGIIRLFIEAQRVVSKLIKALNPSGISPEYLRNLFNALDVEETTQKVASNTPTPSSLVEPLSKREMEVLQLIADGFSNKEISEKLFVALSTIKGHNQKIYDKLGVQRRTEAVARARALGLV